MVDAMREALDALMGQDRNLPPEEQNKPKPKRRLDDPKLCKNFLMGFCPAEEFQRTKHDYGVCTLDHDEGAKEQWEALEDAERDKFGYERELQRTLDSMNEDLRRKIQRNETRLKQNEIPVLVSSEQANINMLSTKITELVRRSEELGEQGDVDGAQAAVAQMETLKAQKEAQEKQAAERAAAGTSRPGSIQYVCELSGVIVSNEPTRIRDHVAGKNYKSWVKLHEKNKELKEILRKRRDSGGYPRQSATNGERSRDRDRDRDRDRHREKDDDRDRERRRQSDHDRRRDDRHRSSHRSSRERSRHRSRERDSTRRRSRERSRDRH